MKRRTVSLPDEVSERLDALVSTGIGANASRVVAAALRHYAADLRALHVASEAHLLDAAEETRLAGRGPEPDPDPGPDTGDVAGPWRRLR